MSRSRVIDLANFQPFQAINVLSDPGHIGGPVVIPNAAKVMLRWTLTDGKVARNVLGGIVAGAFAPTPTMAQAIFSQISQGTSWNNVASFMPTTGLLAGVDILDIRTATAVPVSSTGAAVPGTSASAALPSEIAVCVTLKTANRGQAGRGRMYVPNFATNALAAGDVIAPSVMTNLNTWMTLITAALTAQGIQWALLLPARQAYTGSAGTSHPARAASAIALTAQVVRDNHWDSQRRRGLR